MQSNMVFPLGRAAAAGSTSTLFAGRLQRPFISHHHHTRSPSAYLPPPLSLYAGLDLVSRPGWPIINELVLCSSFADVVLGVDMGTTKTCAAVLVNKGKPLWVDNADVVARLPSMVAFSQDPATGESTVLVGDQAKRQRDSNPRGTIFGFMPLLGRTHWIAPPEH